MNRNVVSEVEVYDRLRVILREAVKNRTGITILLSAEESRVVTADVLDALKEETGYNAMCSQPDPRFKPRPVG